METSEKRVIHSYDTEQHRVLCGFPGLTSSTKRLQSRVEQNRRLVTVLLVETWSIAWRWCSVRTASSDEVPFAARSASIRCSIRMVCGTTVDASCPSI